MSLLCDLNFFEFQLFGKFPFLSFQIPFQHSVKLDKIEFKFKLMI